MKLLALFAAVAVSGCAAGNYAAMQNYIGVPIGEAIVQNGQPESRVRLDSERVAYTFFFDRMYNGTSMQCRFTFIAKERGAASPQSPIVEVRDPGPACR
ncbi:hypothetical protein [Nitratireductor basaltis]|uniref:Lipoprotein n=1 Tax=Nitratireductor basaltis TaxID=472175 RepID=A0A084UDI8_9HYPH|nr:hypothetical protein [Nitratireductor basaltis]KFB11024.1 hypothetical protein EL18_02066 [Nitratireductor basaltis]